MTAMQGVIVKGIGGFYYALAGDNQVYTLRARGVFRKRKITPLVGDTIRFTPGKGEGEGWIDEILPRRNVLVRPPVANLSYLLIVVAPKPKPDLLLADTLLIEARRQKIAPALIINKLDSDAALCRDIRAQYAGTGDPVVVTSVKSGEGLQSLEELLKRGICCFAGQSAVGKSSLVAAVTGIDLDVGEMSLKIDRGKHTTRHAELLTHDGFQVLDTAGFSLLSQTEAEDPVLLKAYYPEFAPYDSQCRFRPCYHHSEPGCAVLKACACGLIAKERVMRYHQLLKNAKEAWEGRYE
ncbi:MAG: ribosome small subunit-dependent GTPase A [Clostridiales bacterium]|nr:ribosome small subunit-dependent GTPase A [Clostridiales bacterium]